MIDAELLNRIQHHRWDLEWDGAYVTIKVNGIYTPPCKDIRLALHSAMTLQNTTKTKGTQNVA